MKRTDSYDTNKHGTSISLLRKAIESQLVLLTEPDLRQLLIAINRKLAGKAEPQPGEMQISLHDLTN